MECRACCYWFSAFRYIREFYLIQGFIRSSKGLCEPYSVPEKTAVWQKILSFRHTLTCRLRRQEWEGQAELYTSKETKQGMVDLSGKPGALDPNIVRVWTGQRKMDQRGPKTKTKRNAGGTGPALCVSGWKCHSREHFHREHFHPFLLVFLQPTFLKCLLPGITQDLWDELMMRTQKSLLSLSLHLPECDDKKQMVNTIKN